MPDIDGKVLSVSGRIVGQNRTIYDVQYSDGETYSTFDNALAKEANAIVNQDASARVAISQRPGNNGQIYTNKNLVAIALRGQLPPEDMMGQAGQVVDGIPIVNNQRRGGPGGRGGGGKFTEADKARVTKLAVLGIAYDFFGRLYEGGGAEAADEASTQALALAHDLYTDARKHETGEVPVEATQTQGMAQNTAPITAPAADPAQVAEAVNEAAGTPVVQTGATVPW